MNYFVTAIGTDCGKTVVSAILCEALGADYWKPVQAGWPRDTETVKALVTNTTSVFHPERFLLNTAVSPHAAAGIDGVTIRLDQFELPRTNNTLIVEGAGGCLVPLNDHDVVADIISQFNMEAIVVSRHYLGSINHTLMTIEALVRRSISIKGLIFNGNQNVETEEIISRLTKLKTLLRINDEQVIDQYVVRKYATIVKQNWNG